MRYWKRLTWALVLVALAASASAAPVRSSGATDPMVFPGLRNWRPAAGHWRMTPQTRIVVDHAAAEEDASIAAALRDDLRRITGVPLSIVPGGEAHDGDIILALGSRSGQLGTQGYALTVGPTVRIDAIGSDGLYYGTQSLLHLVNGAADKRTLPAGITIDYPAYPVRAIMLDVGRRYWAVPSLEAIMREMAWKKMNMLHLHFTDWPAFRLNSPAYPGLAPASASYTRADIAHLEAAAKRYHITIVPEIDLPAHSVSLIRYRPALAFDCKSMRQSPWVPLQPGDAWTVDVTRPENRAWLDGLLREFVPWFDGPYFHIGGDEYQHDSDLKRCPELVATQARGGLRYPGDVMVDWLNEANRTVRSLNKTTIIWSWWRAEGDKTSIQPDRNIVIEVWNRPRQNRIIGDGYRVILAPGDRLYVSPGLARPGDANGKVDLSKLCCHYGFARQPGVLGYSADVWADMAEEQSDRWFIDKAYLPFSLLADRLWTGKRRRTLDDARVRIDMAGASPGSVLPD